MSSVLWSLFTTAVVFSVILPMFATFANYYDAQAEVRRCAANVAVAVKNSYMRSTPAEQSSGVAWNRAVSAGVAMYNKDVCNSPTLSVPVAGGGWQTVYVRSFVKRGTGTVEITRTPGGNAKVLIKATARPVGFTRANLTVSGRAVASLFQYTA